MKKVTFYAVIILCLFLVAPANSQTDTVAPGRYISGYLVDMPTSGIVPHANYEIGLRVYPNGGVLSNFAVGLFDKVTANLFYGGENLIGVGDVNWNPRFGLDVRVRVIDETLVTPAITLGVNSQGLGGYNDNINRYQRKSRGFYAVGSRNYTTLVGDMGVHGGVNFSLEDADDDKDLNFFIGTNISFRGIGEAMIEYDFAANDNEGMVFGKDKGFMNIGFRFFLSNNLNLSFHLTDTFENTNGSDGFGREIRIEFREAFKK